MFFNSKLSYATKDAFENPYNASSISPTTNMSLSMKITRSKSVKDQALNFVHVVDHLCTKLNENNSGSL